MPRARSRSVSWLLLSTLGAGPSPIAQEPWAPGESDVLISEIHYHPAGDGKDDEFVELHNAGIRWVDLSGWSLQGGVELVIPPGTVLGPGEHLALGRDAGALEARQAARALGGWKGSLKNRGGILTLTNRTGRLIFSVHYKDGRGANGGLWPERSDGDGPSLELIQAHPDAHRPWYWAPSRAPGGTPGRENSRWHRRDGARSSPRPDLRIHEYRLDDPGAFVEVLNEGETVKLEGFRLTSHPRGEGGISLQGSAAKEKLTLVKLADPRPLLESAGGEEAAAPEDGAADPAKTGKKKKKKKDGSPERLFLIETATGDMIDSVKLRRGAPEGGSFGIDPQGGNLVTCVKSTPGQPNPAPPASDLVIHEIHYNGQTGSPDEEFVEIMNRGKAAVRLGGWKVDRAISFTFPDGASLPAGGYAVVAGNPEKIRAGLGKAEAELVFGPFSGKLANSGEAIVLVDPRGDETDRVRYGDRPPWPGEADGGGFSLELLHPDADNRWPQAWTLGGPGGTPARKNAHAVKTMPPAIGNVRHDPPVPGPEDQVVIHAQVVDNGGISSVSVVYRDLAGGPTAKKATLADSGKAGDGAAKDGHYAVKLPRLRPGAIVGFAVFAKDSSGRETRFPAGAAECYFQVEPSTRSESGSLPGMPVYRIVMPPDAWDRFQRSPRRQDNLFQCTFIASVEGPGVNERPGEVFYSAALRFRGNNSRNPPDGRMSYRLRIEGGERFDGRDRFILNAYDAFRQKAGNDALRLAGVPTSNATVVRLKTPTFDDFRYVDIEVVNNEFLDERFGSSAGRVYRGTRAGGHGADLAWHGPDPRNYQAAYKPMNKKRDPGMDDLLNLLRALDEKDPIEYVKKVEEALDPAEWAAYFAVNNVLGNDEGGITTDQPDDYFIAQRPDGKFVLVPWDQDSTFSVATLPLFRPRLPSVRRLIAHPRYAPYFHRAVRETMDGPLSLAGFRRWQSHYRAIFAEDELAALESFVERRLAFLRDRYPYAPVASIASSAEGWSPGAGTRTFLAEGEISELQGRVDPAIAFGVRVAGSAAEYDAVRGRFTWKGGLGSLAPGANAVWIECIGPTNEPTFVFPLNVDKVQAVTRAGRVIDGKKEWLAAAGPVHLEGELIVGAGATLRVGPGVSVVCAPGSSITVRGSVAFEGSALEPITFRPADADRSWNGIRILRSGASGTAPHAVLQGCRFEGGEGRGGGGATLEEEFEETVGRGVEPGAPSAGPAGDVFLRVEGARVLFERCVFRGIRGTAVGLYNAHAEMRTTRIASSRAGIIARGGTLIGRGVDVSRSQGTGIRLESLEDGSTMSSFRVSEAGEAGVSIEKGRAALEHGLLLGCQSGLSIVGGARVTAAQLTFAATSTAVEVDAPRVTFSTAVPTPVPMGGRGRPVQRPRPQVVKREVPSGRSSLELTRSVIAPADVPVLAGTGAQVGISQCVVAPAPVEGPKGDGVLAAFPRFAAPGKGDFRLGKGSAGVGKGPGGADWGKVE